MTTQYMLYSEVQTPILHGVCGERVYFQVHALRFTNTDTNIVRFCYYGFFSIVSTNMPILPLHSSQYSW